MENNDNDVLKQCWDLIVAGKDRQLALSYALIGESFLNDRQQELITSGATISEFLRVAMGFNIISVVYVWNNRFIEAAKCDQQYILKSSLWPEMIKVIQSYLEMLMIKKHTEYLDHLFNHTAFKDYFFVHYEAYMSIKNPNFEWTKMREVVPIINRVNKDKNYL